jgi:hypothetical protein
MATSTLIQKLDGTAFESSKTVPGSYTAVTPEGLSNRSQIETFKLKVAAGGGTVSIAAGAWVMFDTSQTGAEKVLCVRTAGASANGTGLTVGVALEAVSVTASATSAAEDLVRVVISGFAEAAINASAGESLVVQTAAGVADSASAGITCAPCGVALTTAAPGLGEVWVHKQF